MTNNSVYCPMIHGGLNIDLKYGTGVNIKHCCLNTGPFINPEYAWDSENFKEIRQQNDNGKWLDSCWTCQANERAGLASLRQGMSEQFGIQRNLSGPLRLDLMFNTSCNLACRSCGPRNSTFWQKHLKDNNAISEIDLKPDRVEEMIAILETLDLSNLKSVVFCGGETLLGESYWRVADYLVNNVPNADSQLILSFQTNGTQPIREQHYSIIERAQLVKLHISLDGVGERFEYLRWPAKWNQVTENLTNIVETAPVNMMFLVEETLSIFNLYYHNELVDWARNNFSTNRLGDITNHTTHNAYGIFSLESMTNEYVEAVSGTGVDGLVPTNFVEKPDLIKQMIQEIKTEDLRRNQDWTKTFPEVAEFYSRYLSSL